MSHDVKERARQWALHNRDFFANPAVRIDAISNSLGSLLEEVRAEALEEASKAICGGCVRGYVLLPPDPGVIGSDWRHPDSPEVFWRRCRAGNIWDQTLAERKPTE